MCIDVVSRILSPTRNRHSRAAEINFAWSLQWCESTSWTQHRRTPHSSCSLWLIVRIHLWCVKSSICPGQSNSMYLPGWGAAV